MPYSQSNSLNYWVACVCVCVWSSTYDCPTLWPIGMSNHNCPTCGSMSVGVWQFLLQLPAAPAFPCVPQAQCKGSLGTTHFPPSSFAWKTQRCLPRGNCLCLHLNLPRKKEDLLISTQKWWWLNSRKEVRKWRWSYMWPEVIILYWVDDFKWQRKNL